MNKLQGEIKKPKVLSFSHYGQLYGANRSLLTLILASRERLDWLVICRQDGPFAEELRTNHINFRIVTYKVDVYNGPNRAPILRGLLKLSSNIATAQKLSSLIASEKIDIVHSNSSVILIGAMAAQFSKKKHLWHFREFVYEDYNSKYNLGKGFLRYWAKKAATIICISKSIQEVRIAQGGIRANNVLIYNGLVDAQIAILPRKASQGQTVFAIIGVINRAKDQLTAIKAINLLVKQGKKVILRIVGDINDPEYYEELTAYIQKENLHANIEFLGFVKEIGTVLADSHITLMCSRMEAFGRVTIESMMHGVPVIAFASAGSGEIIEDGKTGLLYEGQEEDLSDKVIQLLSDPALYEAISRNAIDHVLEHFTIKNYADKFVREVNIALNLS
ncbi:D-inositol-3-phosphate glycosyltransferase [Dyadobacter sp. CECT 9623]|uniref:D-inositol-3-phosphate glycosyltransferase n=1 Tax=Dyadobacter linearis TaxID=2823330 RepID=A0ABN7R8X8_9BACT|nr:glycosyltransferase family 4 protein [Dyadobacter sp. CECT 9623]CAG5069894.1 D-inositol-3-phosphate glycosyltransferase [Dyadobacter sp. CECT 9623]